jgi:lipooligosaccharide transport system ATP-binding protein
MTPILSARNLMRRFGAFEAVRGLTFDVIPGQCVGLLGPNGAGKTTTLRMIIGLTAPSGGELSVFGVPVGAIGRAEKSRIGLVPQEDSLDPDLSVRQNLEVYGRYFGLPWPTIYERVTSLLGFMKLEEKAEARVTALSGGMKRRLVIARALMANPDLVILDEPTTGLDPQARQLIWTRVQELKAQGKTLLLTTHYMDEAQRLCDRIIIIDHGKILDDGAPRELIARHVEPHVFDVPAPVPDSLLNAGLRSEALGDGRLFYVTDPAQVLRAMPPNTPHLHRPANLEDVFVRLTGRLLRDG